MSINTLISNWKTTSAGLLLAGGSVIHLIFAVRSHTADENTWTIALTAIVGGIGLIFAGDASASLKTEKATDPVKPPLPLLLLLGAMAFAPMAVVTGCNTAQPVPRQAVVFYTFKDSWSLAHVAYQQWSERVVLRKVTQEQSDRVDKAWNKYRLAFKVWFNLAVTDWSQPAPGQLVDAQLELTNLIRELSK
jgi:hypothetical protein